MGSRIQWRLSAICLAVVLSAAHLSGQDTGVSSNDREPRDAINESIERALTAHDRWKRMRTRLTPRDAANLSNNLYTVAESRYAEVQYDYEEEAKRLIQEGEDLKRAEERSKKSHSWFKWVVLGYFFYIVSAIRDKEARIGKKNMELAEKFGIYKPDSVEIAIDSLYIIVVIVAVVSFGIIASDLQDDFEKALSTPSSMLIGLGAYLLGNWITCISAGGSKARITFSVFCGTVFCGALITAFVVDVGSKETVLPGLLEWALMLLLIPSLLLWTPKASEWFKQMKIRRELSRAESGNDDSGVVNDEKRQP